MEIKNVIIELSPQNLFIVILVRIYNIVLCFRENQEYFLWNMLTEWDLDSAHIVGSSCNINVYNAMEIKHNYQCHQFENGQIGYGLKMVHKSHIVI